MEKKSLSERVVDFVEATGRKRSKNQLLWLLHGPEIVDAVASGMPKKWIWETLHSEGQYSASYQYFVVQLRQYTSGALHKSKSNKSSVAKPISSSNSSSSGEKKTNFPWPPKKDDEVGLL